MTLTIFVWLHGIGRKFVTDVHTYEFVTVHVVAMYVFNCMIFYKTFIRKGD